jgi:hypothetical protein
MAEQAPPEPRELASAVETIAAWASGQDVEDERLIELARTADAHPLALDGRLERVSALRRRALIRRLRELAAEARPGHEALTEVADRIEELSGNLPLTAEQERLLLKHLLAQGPQREEQLEPVFTDSAGIDGPAIAVWAADAADRGLIELVEPGTPLRRWQITDRGRAALGVPSAR